MGKRLTDIINKCKNDPLLLDFVEDMISVYEGKRKEYDAMIEQQMAPFYHYSTVLWDTEIFSEILTDLSIAILGHGEFHISGLETAALTAETVGRLYYLQDDWCKAERHMLAGMYKMLDPDLQETVLHQIASLTLTVRKAERNGIPKVRFFPNLIYGLFLPLSEEFVLNSPQLPPENQ